MGTQEDLILPQSEELLQTARISVDLLSTVLTSSPQQEALQVLLLLKFCKTGSEVSVLL